MRPLRVAPLAVAGCAFAAAIVLAVSKGNWPSEQFWHVHPRLLLAALVVGAVAPVIQGGLAEFTARGRQRQLLLEKLLHTPLAACLVMLVDGGAPYSHTGVQVFVVRGWRWWRWCRARHVRLAKIRLAYAPPSGVTWFQDKGVIGRCWKEKAEQWAPLDSLVHGCRRDDAHWRAMSPRDQYGLTHDEAVSIGEKYGLVAAVPLATSDGRYIGCMSFDVPPGHTLDRGKCLEALRIASGVVTDHLRDQRF